MRHSFQQPSSVLIVHLVRTSTKSQGTFTTGLSLVPVPEKFLVIRETTQHKQKLGTPGLKFILGGSGYSNVVTARGRSGKGQRRIVRTVGTKPDMEDFNGESGMGHSGSHRAVRSDFPQYRFCFSQSWVRLSKIVARPEPARPCFSHPPTILHPE